MTDYEAKDPNACRKLVEQLNEPLPDADANWLDEDLAIEGSPDIVWYLNVHVCVSVAGKLSVVRTNGTETWKEIQNAGENLAAGAGYLFSIEVSSGDLINLSYSTTGGTICKLRISEVI